MKKRNILLSIMLVMTVLLAACGTGKNPFEGKWVGTLDVTKQFEDGIKANYPDLAEYVDFEDLKFVLDVQFEDGEMQMSVQQESIDAFSVNFEAGMRKMGEGALMAHIASMDMTLEEVVAESGMTEEEYINHQLGLMQIEEMSKSMKDVTTKSLAGLSAVKGTYTFTEDSVNLRYSDGQFEAIGYTFEGDNLILTIKGEGYSLRIVCEK